MEKIAKHLNTFGPPEKKTLVIKYEIKFKIRFKTT